MDTERLRRRCIASRMAVSFGVSATTHFTKLRRQGMLDMFLQQPLETQYRRLSTYAILGVPYDNYSIMGTKTLFQSFTPPRIKPCHPKLVSGSRAPPFSNDRMAIPCQGTKGTNTAEFCSKKPLPLWVLSGLEQDKNRASSCGCVFRA